MAETLQIPYSAVLVASAVVSATGNSANINLPAMDSWMFILDNTASSAPTTLDVALQVTPNGGTTFYDALRFAQITTGPPAVVRLVVQPLQGRGEAGTSAVITTDTLNSALAANCPLSSIIRFRWKIAGTSYTFSISAIGQPRATAV